MELCQLEHYFLKNSLYVEGVKYHRSGHFDCKDFIQYWRCSHYKVKNCKCSAVTKYISLKFLDESADSMDGDNDQGRIFICWQFINVCIRNSRIGKISLIFQLK